jgi:hypothetical protein
MLLPYAATARIHRRADPVTEVICDIGLLKDLFRLLGSAGADTNREFRFADRPLFAFACLKSSSG